MLTEQGIGTMGATIRPAAPEDARDLAQLIDIAGEGIPHWLWSQACKGNETPLDIGEARAKRLAGGFSYTNALVAEAGGAIAGMILGYPITQAPEDNPDELPDPIAPFIDLEAQSVGTWYVNAIAVRPAWRGRGLGKILMAAAEKAALESGHARLSIQVFEQNTGAVRLYRHLGYRDCATSPVRDYPCQPYYTGDVLLLMKEL